MAKKRAVAKKDPKKEKVVKKKAVPRKVGTRNNHSHHFNPPSLWDDLRVLQEAQGFKTFTGYVNHIFFKHVEENKALLRGSR